MGASLSSIYLPNLTISAHVLNNNNLNSEVTFVVEEVAPFSMGPVIKRVALYVGEKFIEYVIVEIIDNVVTKVISASNEWANALFGKTVLPSGLFLNGSSGGSGGGSSSGGFRAADY